MVHVFIDGDACPVKEETLKVAARCLNKGSKAVNPSGHIFTT
jgi:uncharacterized protein YaiI (UPF0178 family)